MNFKPLKNYEIQSRRIAAMQSCIGGYTTIKFANFLRRQYGSADQACEFLGFLLLFDKEIRESFPTLYLMQRQGQELKDYVVERAMELITQYRMTYDSLLYAPHGREFYFFSWDNKERDVFSEIEEGDAHVVSLTIVVPPQEVEDVTVIEHALTEEKDGNVTPFHAICGLLSDAPVAFDVQLAILSTEEPLYYVSMEVADVIHEDVGSVVETATAGWEIFENDLEAFFGEDAQKYAQEIRLIFSDENILAVISQAIWGCASVYKDGGFFENVPGTVGFSYFFSSYYYYAMVNVSNDRYIVVRNIMAYWYRVFKGDGNEEFFGRFTERFKVPYSICSYYNVTDMRTSPTCVGVAAFSIVAAWVRLRFGSVEQQTDFLVRVFGDYHNYVMRMFSPYVKEAPIEVISYWIDNPPEFRGFVKAVKTAVPWGDIMVTYQGEVIQELAEMAALPDLAEVLRHHDDRLNTYIGYLPMFSLIRDWQYAELYYQAVHADKTRGFPYEHRHTVEDDDGSSFCYSLLDVENYSYIIRKRELVQWDDDGYPLVRGQLDPSRQRLRGGRDSW